MSFFDLVKTRYSVRDYEPRPVEDEKLQQILEAARLAPTAANLQPQRILVLKSEKAMNTLRRTTRMAYNAPMAMIICYDKNASWKADRFGDDYDGGEVDGAIVMSMMMMQATDLGVGTLWVRGYKEQDIIDAFEIPDHLKPVGIMLFGYAKGEPKYRGRQTMEEMVQYL